MFQAQVFTLYPEVFPGPLSKGLYGKALSNKLWDLSVINIRDAATDKHKTVDDTPYGGGTGMLLKADVLANALDQNNKKGERVFYLSPKGKKFDQKLAKDLSKEKSISLICGQFEGVDERVLTSRNIEEISIGDYVLVGGEIAAQVLLEGCIRLIPGVLGHPESLLEESFSNDLLEYPHYTRPKIWEDSLGNKYDVPEVLTSGHHSNIKKWRQHKSVEKTKKIRPDLYIKKEEEQD